MQFKVITTLLTLSLAAASALPYDLEWYGYYWNQPSPGRVARTQATQDKSACVAVTETAKNGKAYNVRVCKADIEGWLRILSASK